MFKCLYVYMTGMNQKGFSLMEVAFSIAIITIGLVAVISLFSSNIQAEIKNKNKLIAVYLANESIEVIRQQRDDSWFKGVGWMTSIPTGDVVIVPNNLSDISNGWSIKNVSNDYKKRVYLNSDDVYIQRNVGIPGFWQETRFERYLTIILGDGDDTNTVAVGCFNSTDCMEVVSRVSSNGIQLAEITAYFYDGWH